MQNGSWDIFSLKAFLRFKPFSNTRPLAEGNEKGLLRLQGLLASISLRRTKDKALIGLPPKTIETCFVELSAEQRDLHDQKENEAKGVVRNYIHRYSLTINYSTVLGIILRLHQICADLALSLQISYPHLQISKDLLASISLGRTKNMALPPKTIENRFMELSPKERELCDQMENEAKNDVRNYIHDESVTINYSAVLVIILGLRQICTDLSLCPSDLMSFLPSNSIEGTSTDFCHIYISCLLVAT